MARIIIHLGTHKTGSTSFQQFMVEQAEWLRALGIEPYFEARAGAAPGPNAALVAHDLLRAEVVTSARLGGFVPAPSWRRLRSTARHLRAILAAAGGRDLLISAEAFDFFRTGREQRALRIAFDGLAIVPVVAFREDSAWRRSWRAQMARNPHVSAADLADPACPLLAEWWFDRAAIRQFWQCVGPLVEVDYDAALAADGDVIPALLAAIGLPPPPAAAIWANRSPQAA